MDFIYNLQQNMLNDYYFELYNSFLENKENENILILNQNYYNPLKNFSNYLKKYNTNLFLIFENEESISKLNNENKFEECTNFIHFNCCKINLLIQEYTFNNIHKIVIQHIKSLDYLKKIIDISLTLKTDLCIYISLSTYNKTYFKNKIRDLIKYSSNLNFGNVFDYDEILNLLNLYESFNIINIKLLKSKHVITYGSHKLYLIYLKYKYT